MDLDQCLKKQTPVHVFRRQYLAEQRQLGRRLNPCDKDTWDEVKKKFGELNEKEKECYELQSEASKGMAARAREARRGTVGPNSSLATCALRPLRDLEHVRAQPLSVNASIAAPPDAVLRAVSSHPPALLDLANPETMQREIEAHTESFTFSFKK